MNNNKPAMGLLTLAVISLTNCGCKLLRCCANLYIITSIMTATFRVDTFEHLLLSMCTDVSFLLFGDSRIVIGNVVRTCVWWKSYRCDYPICNILFNDSFPHQSFPHANSSLQGFLLIIFTSSALSLLMMESDLLMQTFLITTIFHTDLLHAA